MFKRQNSSDNSYGQIIKNKLIIFRYFGMKNWKGILILLSVLSQTIEISQRNVIHEAIQAEVITKLIDKAIDDPAKIAQVGTGWVGGSIDGLKKLFGGADNLKDRYRSLQLSIENNTPERLLLVDNYFNSGTWVVSLNPIMPPMSINHGFVANSQGSFFTGVTGGLTLKIGDTGKYISIGFSDPAFGSYKFFAKIGDYQFPATYGYENMSNNYPFYQQEFGFSIVAKQIECDLAQMAYTFKLDKL